MKHERRFVPQGCRLISCLHYTESSPTATAASIYMALATGALKQVEKNPMQETYYTSRASAH